MAGDITELTARYRNDGFAVARGLFEAALLSEVTGEVERVVAKAASGTEHLQVYLDAEVPGSPERCLFRIEEQSELLRDLLGSALLLDVVRPLLEDEPVADGIQLHRQAAARDLPLPVPPGQRLPVLPPAALAGGDAGAGRAG